jgi:hypothetical protein
MKNKVVDSKPSFFQQDFGTAKGLARGAPRCFAALSMTARTQARSAHMGSLISKYLFLNYHYFLHNTILLSYDFTICFIDNTHIVTRGQ